MGANPGLARPAPRRVASAAAAVSLAVAGIAGAAPRWGGAVLLSSAERVVAPEPALNAAGDAVVVWNREQGEVCPDAPDNPACVHVVEVVSRAPGSNAWQPPVEIARPGVGSGPRVALDPAGNAVVVWSHDIGEPRVLQASYRRGRSGSWDGPIDISDERLRAGTQQVWTDAAGNVVAAWARSSTWGFVVQAAVRDAASGIWGPPVDVSRPDTAVLGAPSLAVGPGGHVVLAWVTTTGVVQAAVWAGGWQAPVDLGGGAVPDVDVAVAASGDAAAVWSVRRGAEVVVQAAFRPAASGWMPAVDVAAAGRAGPAVPHVVLDPAGNADAVWIGGGEPPVVQGSKRSRASSTWSPAVAISARGREPIDAPQLAVDPAGNAVIAWTDPDGMTLAAIRPSAGPWQPPSELSAVPTGGVRLALGPVGVVLAVWSRFEPRRIRVEASELGGSGPVLSGLAVPATGRAGVPIELRVEPLAWAAPLVGEPAWNFGDGGTATGTAVRHVFARPGRYTVSVTQPDSTGGTSSAEAAIRISASPPANTARPSIRGRPRAGSTLACLPGRWTGTTPLRFAYRWLRNGRVIPRATARRLRLRAAERGTLIACRVTAANTAGSRSASSRPVRIARR